MYRPVVHLVRGREAFCGPVDEAVDEDQACDSGPHPHDGVKGHARVVDQLGGRQNCFIDVRVSAVRLP